MQALIYPIVKEKGKNVRIHAVRVYKGSGGIVPVIYLYTTWR
jgi:hypothetical protein